MSESRPNNAPRRAAFIIAGGVALCLASCRKESSAGNPNPKAAGMTVVFDSMSKSVNPTALEGMRWQDIAPTAESCSRHGLTEECLKVSETMDSPPVIYLRGLLKFTLGDLPGAAGEWNKLDVAVIPADHLYAPWRLTASGKSRENRYQAPLAKAVAENRASPLVRARFHSSHGRWRDGLDDYLQSDPSSWSPFEIKTFCTMKLHAPCTRDVEVLMAGALAGGRVPESLRGEMARLIKGNPLPDKDALAAILKSDPVLAKAAADGAARALALRQAFASNKFREVVALVHSTDPLQSTDEAVLLGFLSAARIKDSGATELWAGELLRRNPNEKTGKWIATIRAEAR